MTNYFFLFLIFLAFTLAAIYLPHIYFKGVTFTSIILLSVLYIFFDKRLKIKIPLYILFLISLGILIDALGNFFDLYGKKIWFFWYDEMSHLIGTGIVGFSIFWLIAFICENKRFIIKPTVVLIFAFCLTVTLASFYEVTELWDEILFGRHRIWGEHDTARDLQWDMVGGLVGIIVAKLLFCGGGRRLKCLLVSKTKN